jgi:serine/threonine protein kinase
MRAFFITDGSANYGVVTLEGNHPPSEIEKMKSDFSEQSNGYVLQECETLAVSDTAELVAQSLDKVRFISDDAISLRELENRWPASLDNSYTAERILARGGFGLVVLAKDKKNSRVAIKLLNSDPDDVTITQRFLHEAETISRLSHPNVIALLDYGMEGDQPYIVLPFFSGSSLRKRLKTGAMLWRTAIKIAHDISIGLAYIHSNKIVHRDMKPDNILIQKDTAIISDFGISKSGKSGALTGVGVLLGTPGYIAPEILQGKIASEASDIYAFGFMIWEMIVGHRPHQRNNRSRMDEMMAFDEPPEPPSIFADCPRWLDTLILRLLAVDPSDRPSAEEVSEMLADRTKAQKAVTTVVGL